MSALDIAIKNVGGQTALAKKLGVSVQTVHNWVRRGSVPVEHVPNIEAATSGAVTAEELRPDIPWHVIRGVEKRGALDAGKAGDEAAKCGE